jgi:hypothetical protein
MRRRHAPLMIGRAVLGVALVLVTFTAAFAQGIQNHTTNGITHGCPYDPGCTNTSPTDYVRHGYNLCSYCPNDNDMNFSRIRIVRISTGVVNKTTSCNNCFRLDNEYDTNPVRECKFLTRHYVEGPNLSQHDHYTESAPC